MRFEKKSVAVSLSLSVMTLGLVGLGTLTSANSGESKVGSSFTVAQRPNIDSKVQLTGAGASFPAPLYQNWFVQLNRKIPNLQVNYQSVGSGAGIQQFTGGTVDFGASDIGMTDEQMAKVSRGVILLPVTAGSIVIAYNLNGINKLKLSQDAFVGIFSGKITKWNDPKIVKDNPGVKLPDKAITVVHRSDGSGTTAVFTSNLSAMSPAWKSSIGTGPTVQWPSGQFIGSRGNEGVTASIKQTDGAIGYIEFGFAKNNNLQTAVVQNKAGKFIEATAKTGAATLASVKLPANLRAFINNPSGADSYPFVTFSWLLVPKKFDDPKKALGMQTMIDFAINEGQKQAEPLGYIPLPKEVRQKVAAAAQTISPAFKIQVR